MRLLLGDLRLQPGLRSKDSVGGKVRTQKGNQMSGILSAIF